MSISKSHKADPIMSDCDHITDRRQTAVEEKRLIEEELQNWEEVFKKLNFWGPEKFNFTSKLVNSYSLLPFSESLQINDEQMISSTLFLTSREAVLLINDLDKLLCKLSQHYADADTKAKRITEEDYKKRIALENVVKDYDDNFQRISKIDEICYHLFNLSHEIHATTGEILMTNRYFDDIIHSDDQQQNVNVILDHIYPEQLQKTKFTIQKCNEGLKLLDKCESVLNEALAIQNLKHMCSDGKSPWMKSDETFNLELENHRHFTITGAIPKAYRSKNIKRNKNSKKSYRKNKTHSSVEYKVNAPKASFNWQDVCFDFEPAKI